MLIPKRTKYRKPHRVSYDGHAKGNTELHLGDYGLMAKEGAWISARQIVPHLALTKKPLETRQGTGKGNVDDWVAVVKKGKIMFEISDIDEATAREALRLASHKLPVTCKFVKKEGISNEG